MNTDTVPVDAVPAEATMPVSPPPEHDRLVQPADVVAFAKARCKWCTGTGFVKKWGAAPAPNKPQTRYTDVCGCAQKRFEKKYDKENFIIVKGQVYWRVGKAP